MNSNKLENHNKDIFPYLHSESNDSVWFFQQMAYYGFLTTNSQEGRKTKGIVPKDTLLYQKAFIQVLEKNENENKNQSESNQPWEETKHEFESLYMEWYHEKYPQEKIAFVYHSTSMKERAYVTGFIFKPLAALFHLLINQTDCITYEVMGLSENEMKKRTVTHRIPVTYDISNVNFYNNNNNKIQVKRELLTPLPDAQLLPSTLFSATESNQNCKSEFDVISKTQWEWFFHGKFQDVLKNTQNQYHHPKFWVFFECLDPKFGRLANTPRKGLYHKILKALHFCHHQYTS